MPEKEENVKEKKETDASGDKSNSKKKVENKKTDNGNIESIEAKEDLKNGPAPQSKISAGIIIAIVGVALFITLIVMGFMILLWYSINAKAGLDYSGVKLEELNQSQIKDYLLDINENVSYYKINSDIEIRIENSSELSAIKYIYDYKGYYNKPQEELDFEGKIYFYNNTTLINYADYDMSIKNGKIEYTSLLEAGGIGQKNESNLKDGFFKSQDAFGNSLKAIYNSEIEIEGIDNIQDKEYYKIKIKPSPVAVVASFPNMDHDHEAIIDESTMNSMTQEQLDAMLSNYSYTIWVNKETLLIEKSSANYEANIISMKVGLKYDFILYDFDLDEKQYNDSGLHVAITPTVPQMPVINDNDPQENAPLPDDDGDDPTPPPDDTACTDDCDQEGLFCNGSRIYNCSEGLDGCLNKDRIETCGTNQRCVENGQTAECEIIPLNCINLATANQKRNLTSNAECVVISAKNVTLDCKGYSITNNKRANGINITSNDSTVNNCTILNTKRGVYINQANNVSITNSIIRENQDYGIYSINSNDIKILDSLILKNAKGIYLNSSNNRLLNVIIANHSDKGLILGLGGFGSNVESSVICNNTINLNCSVDPASFLENTCYGTCGSGNCTHECFTEPKCQNASGCEGGAGSYCSQDFSGNYTCLDANADGCFERQDTACEINQVCKDGACVNLCEDSDNGKDYVLIGTCKDNLGDHFDSCSANLGSYSSESVLEPLPYLNEWFCNSTNQCELESISCLDYSSGDYSSGDYSCYSGQCSLNLPSLSFWTRIIDWFKNLFR